MTGNEFMSSYCLPTLKLNKMRSSINHLTIGFFIIIFQSFGVRIFDFQGIFLSCILLLLSISKIKSLSTKNVRILVIVSIYLLMPFLLSNFSNFNEIIYPFSLFISSFFFIMSWKKISIQKIQNDFYSVTKFFVYHSLLSFLLFLIFPSFFNLEVGTNYSMGYIFYTSKSMFLGINRNVGIFWEPGINQYISNLFLFLSIIYQNKKNILVGIISVLICFSTAGFILLALNFIFILLYYKIRIRYVYVVLLIPILFIGYINFNEKINNANSTSGKIRYRDFKLGLNMVKEKPLFGHGWVNSESITNSKNFYSVNRAIFKKGYISHFENDLPGGYTNGLFKFIVTYGILAFLISLYFLKYNFLIINVSGAIKIIFILQFLLTMMSSPIGITSFVFLMIFSCRAGYTKLN